MIAVILALVVALVVLVVLSAPLGSRDFKATKRGVIMMYCTPNIAGDWARYTIEINRKYAERHNYGFVVVSSPYDPKVTHAWQKIPAMIELLDRGAYEFVVYMDADAIVNKHEVPYERFLARYTGDIIVCSDEANSAGLYAVNGGMVIARNTSAARTLLTQWWALRYAYPEFAFEQWALSDIVRGKHPHIDGRVVSVAPETDFNSVYGEVLAYVRNMDTGRPDRFVLHLMSMDDATRRAAFSRLHTELVSDARG